MKRYIILLGIVMAAASCSPPAKEVPQISGAYNQLTQSWKGNDTDTTVTGQPQLKIFTDDFVMYARFNPVDSTAAFGIGSYIAEAGRVTENIIYSASDTSASSEAASYQLEIEKLENGFKQVIRNIELDSINYELIETYETVSAEATSPLDGVWQLTRLINVTSEDTTVVELTQYKAYYAGNFIFGHTYQDSTQVLHTGIGFGTFEMNTDSLAIESPKASNYKEILGRTFNLDIRFSGPDEYTQTIVLDNGTKEIETYSRMKK